MDQVALQAVLQCIPAGLRVKCRAAWSTGSSTSSGEEDRGTKSLEAENKELRARRRKGKESKEARASIQERKRPGGRVVCGNGPRGLGHSRKKLDEQKEEAQEGAGRN